MKKATIAIIILGIIFLGTLSVDAAIPAGERASLIALYNATGGDTWTDNSGWKTPPLDTDGFAMPGTEGGWYGISVSADTVTQIHLSSNNLAGALPTEIGDLTGLITLSLDENQLSGSIPAEIGNLVNLEYFYLDHNQLSGNIPTQLGGLANLQHMHFHVNDLTGGIPIELGNLASLTSLILSDNTLGGSIPPELGNLTSLENLNLGHMQLTGNIPAELGDLTNLTDLILAENQLSGTIPTEIGNLSVLATLNLSQNQLSGSIPAEIGNLTSLTNLNLDMNQLAGTIPTTIGNLTNLTELILSENQLTGPIPTEMGNLTSLTHMNINMNQLSGSIPTEIESLTNLTFIDLDCNQLSGNIPTQFGNLTGLTNIHLGQNQLTGSLPAEIGNLIALETLYLAQNQLSGSIPSELGNLSTLGTLNLEQNQLSGSIPAILGNLNSLTELRLDFNLLSGSIPPELGNLINLTYLGLMSNQLSGSIPPELGQLSNLIELALVGNQLSGNIPPELGNLSALESLMMNSNQLSGSIPPELGQLTNLRGMLLYLNQLTGPLPPELANLTNLQGLWLDYNQLSGPIPDWLGSMTQLTGIGFAQNQFSGPIPTEFGNLVNLTDLQLWGNQLEGPIPISLTNLTQLGSDTTHIGYNALYSEDSGLNTFLDGKDPDWANTQTVPPTGVSAATAGATSVTVSWTPILYTGDDGGYRVFHAASPGGPYTLITQTADKTVDSQLLTGLSPGETHYFVVQTRTDPHGQNDNTVDSHDSNEVSASTSALYISGYVTFNGAPLPGVTLTGLPGDPVTDAEGFYIAAVLPNWSGKVTPALTGFSFSPPNRDYTFVTSSFTYQDYTATESTGEPNDDIGSATELPLGTTENLIFAEGDNDFYRFYVPPELAGLDLKVNVRVTSPYPDPPPDGWSSDLDFELLDSTPRLLGRVISSSDDETLYLHNVASGWYYVHVDYSSTEYADSCGYARYAITLEAGTAADFGIGYITGRVIDEVSTGRGDVFLMLHYAPDDWNRCRPYMTSNPDGTFAIAFTPDNYTLGFSRGNDDLSAFHTPPNVLGEYYNGTRDYDNAQQITITAGQTQNLGDIELQTGAIVTGNVTDGSANPLAYVTVQAFDLNGDILPRESARTDAAGNYTLSGVPVGGARIRFTRAWYGIEFYNDRPSFGTADNLATVAGETLTGINAQLEERGIISGTVTDGGGSPIANVRVNVYSVTDGTYRVRYGSTDANGYYRVSYIKPGDYKVQFDPEGLGYHPEWYDDAGDFAAAAVVTVIENTIETIDAQLDAMFSVSGTVTSGGQPLEGVVLSGLPGDPVTNGAGNYSAAVDTGWSGTVTPTLAGFTFTPADRTYASVSENQAGQDYTAVETSGEPNDDPGSATEIPMGTTGNLIFDYAGGDQDFFKFYVPPELAGLVLKVNARIITPIPEPPHNEWQSDLDFELLDASERLVGRAISRSGDETLYLHNVASGWYYMHVDFCATWDNEREYDHARYEITLETGTPAELGVGVITGRLVDGGGGGLGDVFLVLNFAPDDWNRCRPYMTSNPDGTFAVAFTPDTYTLMFSKGNDLWSSFHSPPNVVGEYYNDTRDYGSAQQLTITAGQNQNLGDIELETGAIITGTVTDLSANPLSNVAVIAYDLNNIALSNESVYTDAAGGYTIRGVPPDGAKLRVTKYGYADEFYNDQVSLGTADILPTVAGATLDNIDMQMALGGTITGTVTDGGGNPIGNVRVWVYSTLDAEHPIRSIYTNSGDGTYLLYRLQTGDYKVFFDSTGLGLSEEWYNNAASFADAVAVSVTSGQNTPDIDAALDARLTISGTVYMGVQPLEGVNMTGLPGNPVTDAFGRYSAQVDRYWSGVVAPELDFHIFTPEQRIYNGVTENQSGQDYTAELVSTHTITGCVTLYGEAPLAGVTMSGLPGDPVTDENGYYSGTVFSGWIGDVTPILEGYTFTPDLRPYNGVSHDYVAQHYEAQAASPLPASERAALIALYNATGGDAWTNHSGWKEPPLHHDGFAMPGTESTWYGVSLNANRVRDIALGDNNLNGSIPVEIGDLTDLTGINLSHNALSGPLPATIGNLSNLAVLLLNHNQLSGNIPVELGNLTNLIYLYLYENELSGSIPAELGNLSNLACLYLHENQLSGSIPSELGNLSNLQQLGLCWNQLSGSIPAELGNLANLVYLYLYNNQLSGTIPTELGNLGALEYLALDQNQLTGTIPPELGNLSNLRGLYLFDNQLTGPIPPELGNLTQLRYLRLETNQLTGTIPDSLQNLTNLTELWLRANQLTGTIPTWLGNLTQLEALLLSNNQLSGEIPTELGNLTHLEWLMLSYNQLTGPIPAELDNLTNLKCLYLQSNQMTGTIPAWLGNLGQLLYLSLADNQFSGTIPPELGTLSNLELLNLQDNRMTGVIPPTLGNLGNLTELWLNRNQLSGAIPAELGNLSNLTHLNLSANQFSGVIPPALQNMSSVNSRYTDIGYNALYATDPILLTFLDVKDSDWDETQTIAPENVAAATINNTTIQVTWDAIPYTSDSGGYRVYVSITQGGPYTFFNQTANKMETSMLVSGLAGNAPHYFVVQTRTDPHGDQQNALDSEYSAEASAATAPSTFTISGTITLDGSPLSGVVMAGLPGEPTTDASGNYMDTVVYGWSGTVTPTLTGYTFNAPSTTYTNVASDQVTDYTAEIISSLSVTSPNGGEVFHSGSVQVVTWSSEGSISNVRIEYSTDNMVNWSDIIASTPNDGTCDWAIPDTPSTQCWVRISDATDGDPVDTNDSAFVITVESGSTFVNNGVWQTADPGVYGWYTGDFTGDGITDIMNVTYRHQKVFESDGTQFIKLGSWIEAVIGSYGWFPGNFSGDGMTDLLRYREVDRTQVFLSTGAAFVKDFIWYLVDPGPEGYTIGDYNGDGMDDMLIFDEATNHSKVYLSTGEAFADPTSWFTGNTGEDGWYSGDFNGDGKTDVARVNLSLGTQVMLSDGSAFVEAGVWTPALPPSNGWFVGDYNGDGKDDLMRCREDLSGAEVFLSTGTAFRDDGCWCDVSLLGADWRVGDFTGDNRDDLLRYNPDTWEVEVFESTPATAPASSVKGSRNRTDRDLNEEIDLSRPVLSQDMEADLLRPWLEKIRNGEEGNCFFRIKKEYEKRLGRKVRDTVIFRMLHRLMNAAE